MYDKAKVLELLAQPRTKDNINELVSYNNGLLRKQLRRFYLVNDPEAISWGYEAMYNAILTYDANKGSSLGNYIMICIYNRLGTYVRQLKTQQDPILYEMEIKDGTRLVDTLEHPDKADTDVSLKETIHIIANCYNQFTNPTHRRILNHWILSEFTMSTTEVAKAANCSQPYASTVINNFKNKLEVMLK